MKRIFTVFTLLMVLVGCGASAKEKTTYCSISTEVNGYKSTEYVYTSKADKVTNMQMKALLETQTKEEMDQVISLVDSYIGTLSELEGLVASVERISDTELYDITSVDIEKADIDTLVSLGLVELEGDEKAVYISLKQSVAMLEASGFTCAEQ